MHITHNHDVRSWNSNRPWRRYNPNDCVHIHWRIGESVVQGRDRVKESENIVAMKENVCNIYQRAWLLMMLDDKTSMPLFLSRTEANGHAECLVSERILVRTSACVSGTRWRAYRCSLLYCKQEKQGSFWPYERTGIRMGLVTRMSAGTPWGMRQRFMAVGGRKQCA